MVVSGGSPEEAVQTSCAFFDSILSSSGSLEAQLSPFLESILIDSVSVGISRKVLSYVILKIKSMSKIQSLKYCSTLTEALKLRLMSFEDQITDINQHMADLYESQQDYNKAAFHLSAIPLENSQKNYTKIFTTQMYLKIAQLYIEGHDANQAEIFINRASLLITSNTDPDLQVKYKLCYAKLLDFRKKFLEAARRYLELSLEIRLPVSDQNELLRLSILCAIIAPAGLHRSRLLSSLSKDERSQHFIFHPMLKNTQLGHLITRQQVEQFEKELEEHQQETLPTGMSILEAAVMEHNLLALSNIYKSIKISNLAHLLRVPLPQAEKVVGKMISEQRILGSIDQIDQIIYFEPKALPWNEHIDVVCNKVNNVIDLLTQYEPDFTKERLQHYGC